MIFFSFTCYFGWKQQKVSSKIYILRLEALSCFSRFLGSEFRPYFLLTHMLIFLIYRYVEGFCLFYLPAKMIQMIIM